MVFLRAERIARPPPLPQLEHRVGAESRGRDVGRVNTRTNENVPRLYFARLDTIDANDVETERRLDDRAQLPGGEREHPPFELRDHLRTPIPAKVAPKLLG